MADLVELTLRNGRSVYVETQNHGVNLSALHNESEEEGVIQESFDLVSDSIAAVAESIEEKISSLNNKPSKVVVELSAQVEAGGFIVIANGTAKGAIKLQMTWES